VRRDAIVPKLAGIAGCAGTFEVAGDGAVVVRWRLQAGELTLAANLSDVPVAGFPASPAIVYWQEGHAGSDGVFGPWTVRWSA
jgi:hypothetical protein